MAVEPTKKLSEKTCEIHIASHGWHTGVILPSGKIYKKLPELKSRFGDLKFLEIGWGDSGFYQANEITSGITFRAIFIPTGSVVHIVGFSKDPQIYFDQSEVKKVKINEAHIETLVEFISNSIKRNDKNEMHSLRKGIYGDSQFIWE